MIERASGWYDDPQDPDQLRYWDGILWSDRTMPKVKPGLEQSRIGDAKRQYEEEQERRHAAEQARARSGGPDPHGRPQSQGYRQPPYGYQQPYPQRPVKVTPDGQPTASWWQRLFAYIIDNVILSALTVALSWTWLHPWVTTFMNWYDDLLDAAEAGRSQPPIPQSLYQVPWQVPVIAAVLYLVYEVALVAWRGQTIGHLICGIRVRGAGSSAKPGFNAAVLRAVVKGANIITSVVPFLGSLGLVFGLVDGLVPLGDRHAQSIHDKAAKTYVVNSRAPKPPYGGPPPPPPYAR